MMLKHKLCMNDWKLDRNYYLKKEWNMRERDEDTWPS